MNFNIILIFIAICGLNILQAAVLKQKRVVDKNSWDLLEALKASSQIRGFNGTWITDNEFYYTDADESIGIFDAGRNRESTFLTSDFLKRYDSSRSFKLSPDNTKILIRYNVVEIFRHSYVAKYNVFDIATNKTLKIHNGENLQYCDWSPAKNRLAYVYKNNVFLHFEEDLEVKITSDGIDGVLYNGIPDWVYEEEVLESQSAMWWSDDAKFLAVGVFDDAHVKTFTYSLYGEAADPNYQYPKDEELKYPKPGTNNPVVSLRVFNVSDAASYVTIKAPVKVVSSDHIMQNVVWTRDGKLLITWLNRRQNIASLQLCSVAGDCHEVKRIEEPKGWVSIGKPLCLTKTQNCLFTYWIDNWYQVWNLNLETGKNEWHALGNFTVLALYGYDESNDKIYYQATLERDPTVIHVFSNSYCLTCNLTDGDGEKCLSATALFSKNYSYYTASCIGPSPRYSKIFETETNKEVRSWELNSDFRSFLRTKLMPTSHIMNVTLADGTIGVAKLLLPPNLDRSKKYPMIVNVYGGPNSVRVTNNFAVGYESYLTTNRDIIYVLIDGRGTGNKGKDLLFSVNNHLGEFEVEDQIHVTKYFQSQLPFVDKDRCGIWGWSYGGYMTARTLANDTEKVFRCGISGAPVTSWLYYDSIYTERYMGVPAENWHKYLATSVLQHVENFRNHGFMLIHGSGDDNVHYQQSMMLAKILQANDILFEQMTYTDENHSVRRFTSHLYHTMDRFWTDCFKI